MRRSVDWKCCRMCVRVHWELRALESVCRHTPVGELDEVELFTCVNKRERDTE